MIPFAYTLLNNIIFISLVSEFVYYNDLNIYINNYIDHLNSDMKANMKYIYIYI